MGSAEYDAEIARTDCMVLPYRRDAYFARISGVAVEAVTAGIPVIYTLDTWCADFVNEHGAGIGMRDGDVAALVSCIDQVVKRYREFSQASKARIAVASAKHSATEFLDKLWGLTPRVAV